MTNNEPLIVKAPCPCCDGRGLIALHADGEALDDIGRCAQCAGNGYINVEAQRASDERRPA